ncbi:hypothetical protein L195_g061601, partial [Trifolium pratense]
NALDTFLATHCNPLNKNEKLPIKGGKGPSRVELEQDVELKSIEHANVDGAQEMVSSHLNYHRDPGLKESKFFHGPMMDDREPVLEPSVHPKTIGGGSLETEIFMDAKESGDTSTEEWDVDIAG